jgi:thiamine-phosphate pyrophosphorylase
LNPSAHLPRFYPIVDAARFSSASDPLAAMAQFALELLRGGASLIQYRNKSSSAREMLAHARELRRAIQDRAMLIMNDRTDLCLAAAFAGVHLGQDDLSPPAARQILQKAGKQDLWIGFSTHNPDQLREAEHMPVDYIAVGPVFATGSKANPDPVIGLEGVRQARQLTAKPLVAIGGISRQNCISVINAGADSVAVIADVVESPRKSTQEFLRILG